MIIHKFNSIVFYKGIDKKYYLYPLNLLCPNTYYFVECITYDGGVELNFPHLKIPAVFLTNTTWEKEFK